MPGNSTNTHERSLFSSILSSQGDGCPDENSAPKDDRPGYMVRFSTFSWSEKEGVAWFRPIQAADLHDTFTRSSLA